MNFQVTIFGAGEKEYIEVGPKKVLKNVVAEGKFEKWKKADLGSQTFQAMVLKPCIEDDLPLRRILDPEAEGPLHHAMDKFIKKLEDVTYFKKQL